jgi:peptidoglycan/LPS O-acetylase OafA/YrhL
MTMTAAGNLCAGKPPLRSAAELKNLNELRFLFAACVLVSHAVQLAGFADLYFLRRVFSSEVAVQGFFILSGYLVLRSFERSTSVMDFYKRRALRIYPAYVVAVVLFLGLAVLQQTLRGTEVAWEQIPRYLAMNLMLANFLQPGIDGVFQGSRIEEINGALWTIKVEAMFYLIVPALSWLGGKVGRYWVSIALAVVGVSWAPLLEWFGRATGTGINPSFYHQLPGQLQFFAVGGILYASSKGEGRYPELFKYAAILLVALLSTWAGGMKAGVQVAGLAAVILISSNAPQLRTPLTSLDPSYGLYLAHFPIIQLLICAGVVGAGAGAFIGLTMLLAIGYGVLSWQLIEKPILKAYKERHS